MNALKQPATMSPVLSVNHLSVTYQGETVPTIHDCSFEACAGEAILITGPSGSGKSTLAMAIAGIIPRSVEGVVEGEIDLCDGLRAPGKIGYVFQDPDTQFCMLSVEDEISFGLENLSTPRDEMSGRTREALWAVNLDVSPTARHANFSGGMKQKLAIASALAMECELLILDEPTANLDPHSTHQVFELLAELRQQGRTLIIIEHKYEPLLPFIDKVVSVSSTGAIEQICSAPAWAAHLCANVRSGDQSHACVQEAASHVPGEPVLSVDHAALTYGTHQVWHDVSFSLYPGEWIALVGPNGTGKSSLLEVMGGLTKPTRGIVQIHGTPLSKLRSVAKYKAVAFGFQNPEYQFLFERVGDEMAGRVVGESVPPDVLANLVEFGLGAHAFNSPYALSQGQKRRLAVGSMLRDNHDVYLFDEPTYGQDAVSEQVILACLQQLRQQGKTVVTVTHDMNLVKQYASRVLVIASGKLLYDGSVSGLFTREDVLHDAHLLDDVRPLLVSEDVDKYHSGLVESALNEEVEERDVSRRKPPLAHIHPGVKLFALLFSSVLTLFADNFTTVGRLWVLPMVLAFALGWCNPWQMLKRLWLIVLLYGIYLWTFAANAAIPPGYRHVDWLWFHISMYGMWTGVLVALRTFATVVLAYVFLETTDGTDFVVSLSQSFQITPKLSYGVMAGTGFIPRFQHELRTFRLARQVRGRQGWWVTSPVTYALPMLSQSIRLSERVATAMETRGFFGPPAESAKARTYFRSTPLRVRDFIFAVLWAAMTIGLFYW